MIESDAIYRHWKWKDIIHHSSSHQLN